MTGSQQDCTDSTYCGQDKKFRRNEMVQHIDREICTGEAPVTGAVFEGND